MKRYCVLLALCAGLDAQQIPRPEFPQPQFQRAAWVNLNGPWEFEFDDQDAGIAQGWDSGARKFSRSILAPYCFESKLGGIGDTGFHPVAWYRRTFSIPPEWKDRRVLLKFGAVDYRASVWVNGRMAGAHEGGNTPFGFDITPLLKAGTNTLVVRAEDPPTDRSIPRGKQYWELKSRGIFYTRTSGIWQTVWLEAAGVSYLDGVRITPRMDGTVRFAARIARPRDGLIFAVSINDRNHPVASGTVEARGPRTVLAAAVPDRRLWSVNAPNLYDVTLELREGERVIDRVQSYFGFRSIETRNGRVLLNGRPEYLKFVLDQGYWPESILTPPSDAAIQYDIRMAKEMGFNGARKHQKLADPRFLYWADRMGFLVSSEMANAQVFDDQYVERFTREWMEAVERDYNHPSIVMWTPINESWGVPDLHDPRQQNHLKELYRLTKTLDSTRPVVDNDGWEHTDATDLFTLHDYARTGALLYEKYKDVSAAAGARLPDNGRAALAPGYTYNGTPLVLSEFGGIAFIPPGHQVPPEAWGYSGVEETVASALDRLRGLYEALGKLSFAGICYTQLTDVEQEINGLMTYDRKPKFDVGAVKEINRMVK
ncbi:MAG: sugar-binding domain-containing protein [Bryobacteraceae bacterium]